MRPEPQGTRSTRRVLPLTLGTACRMVSGVLRDGCVGTVMMAVLCSGQGPCPRRGCAVLAHVVPTARLLLCQLEPQLLLN